MRKPIIWQGIKYESMSEAARALGIHPNTMFYRVRHHLERRRDMYQALKQGKKVEWNGIQYPSISAAARANNVTFATMRERLLKGYTCDDEMTNGNAKHNRNNSD